MVANRIKPRAGEQVFNHGRVDLATTTPTIKGYES